MLGLLRRGDRIFEWFSRLGSGDRMATRNSFRSHIEPLTSSFRLNRFKHQDPDCGVMIRAVSMAEIRLSDTNRTGAPKWPQPPPSVSPTTPVVLLHRSRPRSCAAKPSTLRDRVPLVGHTSGIHTFDLNIIGEDRYSAAPDRCVDHFCSRMAG